MDIEKIEPKNWNELVILIEEAIELYGYNCDLNFIDTSEITDMARLFHYFPIKEFNGDISEWDTSNVTNMSFMFYGSKFNGDISKWNVSNVAGMHWMFKNSKLEEQNKLPEWYNGN